MIFCILQGNIQFFVSVVNVTFTEDGRVQRTVTIVRFPIDLELSLGSNFTERTTYNTQSGSYNISLDMSFRVQCLENYFGPNCTTFCEPLEGVYTCDSEGNFMLTLKICQ